MITNTNNICYSGGAVGADFAWGEAAVKAGHHLVHYVFKGHKGSNGPHAVVLDPTKLHLADPYLKTANQTLKRSWPAHSDFVSNLLRRNYFQIKSTDAVYAIAEPDGPSVYGGTAWAVEMFKILQPSSENIFTFNQKNGLWYKWSGFSWAVVSNVPRPSGKWTGIGTRDLTPNGIKAINGLFTD